MPHTTEQLQGYTLLDPPKNINIYRKLHDIILFVENQYTKVMVANRWALDLNDLKLILIFNIAL